MKKIFGMGILVAMLASCGSQVEAPKPEGSRQETTTPANDSDLFSTDFAGADEVFVVRLQYAAVVDGQLEPQFIPFVMTAAQLVRFCNIYTPCRTAAIRAGVLAGAPLAAFASSFIDGLAGAMAEDVYKFVKENWFRIK